MASIEEKVEEFYKKKLDDLGVKRYGKNEKVNDIIANALRNADSKSGGSGNNYPDIQVMLTNNMGRYIPIMIEAKGSKGKLIKYAKDGKTILGVVYYDSDGKPGKDGIPTHKKGEPNYSAIRDFAVNGAIHYGNTILNEENHTYNEVIVIGINGTTTDSNGELCDREDYR